MYISGDLNREKLISQTEDAVSSYLSDCKRYKENIKNREAILTETFRLLETFTRMVETKSPEVKTVNSLVRDAQHKLDAPSDYNLNDVEKYWNQLLVISAEDKCPTCSGGDTKTPEIIKQAIKLNKEHKNKYNNLT